MKKRMMIVLAVAVIALAVVSPVIYWHHVRPWQQQVRLDSFYNVKVAALSPHDQNRRNNLNQFPTGYRIFNEVRFNVAGLIQLANSVDVSGPTSRYPSSVEGIPVNRYCRMIHLLHGSTDGTDNGTLVASLILHYADGSTNALKIVYGQQVYDWWFHGSDAAPLADDTVVAWVGDNDEASKSDCSIRVFQTTFTNPQPEVKIESVDYVSGLSKCAPFLLALTVE